MPSSIDSLGAILNFNPNLGSKAPPVFSDFEKRKLFLKYKDYYEKL